MIGYITDENKRVFIEIYFILGPRNCIGQKFALLEIKSMVSKVLRAFKVSVDPSFRGLELVAEVVLRSQTGILLNLEPRK